MRALQKPTGWDAHLKFHKYMQLAGTLNDVYLPVGLDWAKILRNAKEPILITEGEFKSICGAEHGFNCIGLGGVSTWSAKKRGIDLLFTLADATWSGRTVYIVFDSDAASKEGVALAQTSADAYAKKVLFGSPIGSGSAAVTSRPSRPNRACGQGGTVRFSAPVAKSEMLPSKFTFSSFATSTMQSSLRQPVHTGHHPTNLGLQFVRWS